MTKHDKQLFQLLQASHQYLANPEDETKWLAFQKALETVEAIVEAFERMREDLDQERRAAERQWAKRTKQIESVTFNISGMYGDLQGLVPTLPSIARLELLEPEMNLAS